MTARSSVVRFAAAEAPPLGAIFGAIGALAGAATVLLGLDRLPFAICYMKALTGIPCPTCGATRALAHLVQFDPAAALAMNPLAAGAALLVALWAAADLLLLPRRRALAIALAPGAARALRVAAPILLAANWVYLVAAGR
jgi:hypothetical protein